MSTRPCRVCGLPFQPARFDALTCSDTCRQRRHRGLDLAYLAELPPDQARFRKNLHATIDDEIAIQRMVSASRREGRAARRKLPAVKQMRVAR
jgi:hypothetical protein